MAKTKSNPNNAIVWKSYPKPLVKSVIQDLVHFSAKVVNSNALPAGVRLSKDQRLHLPYVAVLTIGADAVPLDYVKNAGAVATIVKAFQAVSEKVVQVVFQDAPADEVAFYAECQNLTSSYHEVGLNSIGKRLRQIIVQTCNGHNLAVTPMTSAGFGALLQRKLQREQEEAPDTKLNRPKQRPHGLLRIGGANPQNVGQHIRTLQRPLWFSPPQVDQNLRKAYVVYFSGINLGVPQNIYAEYDRQRRCKSYDSKIQPVAVCKDLVLEDWFMQKYVETIKERVEEARNLLEYYRESFPKNGLLDRSVSPEMCALIDPQQQFSGWRRQLAIRLYSFLIKKIASSDTVDDVNAKIHSEHARLLFKIEKELESTIPAKLKY